MRPVSTGGRTTALENDPRLHEQFERDAELIDGSGLFDEGYYAAASGRDGDRGELIRHFLSAGEAEHASPSREFDVVFYRLTNPDVASSATNSLVHYIRHGRAEGRYPNQRRLRRDAEALERSGVFDGRVPVRRHKASSAPGLSDLEYYLASRDARLRRSPSFDEEFYANAYDDVRSYPGKPLLHYVAVGRGHNRVTTEDALRERMRALESGFDAAYYVAQLAPDEQPADPLEHYVLHGSRRGLDPAPSFCADYYIRRYPDLGGKALDLFEHYLVHGRGEGRTGRPDFSDWFVRGNRTYDLTKPTVVVANHEASRTGAPLVGLMLGANLVERYNVITLLGKSGPLDEHFLEHSVLVAIGRPHGVDAEYLLRYLNDTHNVDALVLNSVETSEYAFGALYAGIPSVALLHEFAEYSLPAGKMSRVVQSVDRIVVPADLIRDSLQREVSFHCGGPANNVVVRPQGYLPQLPRDDAMNDLSRGDVLELLRIGEARTTKIVLGAGYVQMRKGVDLFVQTAAAMRELYGDDIRFVWVGDGYDPAHDIQYSAWVSDMVRRLGLEDHVFFFAPQANLDVLFELADVFYLPSRLDPFPNVVLDAFMAGKPVVCFDGATGVAPILRSGAAHGAAVAFCDVREAARALGELMTGAERGDPAANRRFVEKNFHFGEYVAFIGEQIEAASAARRDVMAAARRIKTSGAFDAAFHGGHGGAQENEEQWRSIVAYAARGLKGLAVYDPRPGFSEGLYWSRNPGRVPNRPALDDALALASPLSSPPATHRCVTLGDAASAPYTGRAAVHLHLHYADLAPEFAELLDAAHCRADLFVTTTSPVKRLEIEYAFRNHKLGRVRVLEVPNRGRDIGPLITVLAPHLRTAGYDLIGHLHGKRSVSVDAQMGDRWRTYLTRTLVGDRDNLAQILSLFGDDEHLGLVFAEDRHAMGWTKNGPFAVELAARLTPRPHVPDFPVFPLGTMFWARPAVLEPLWRSKLEPGSFPVEPAPYDGTILHAIERMLPAIAESTGHSWTTVYRPGDAW
ncbi:MAG: glycosyltransferase [Candidatus Eremiobacteraeota bacterium]|nr:glycosyltransferase [Candidatus Eremiobacteraeota bacterium]